MKKINDFKFRALVLFVFTFIFLALSYFYFHYKKEVIEVIYANQQVKKSLEKTFFTLYYDAKKLGSKNAVTLSIVKQLHKKYNEKNKHVFLVSIDKSYARRIPMQLEKKKQQSLKLNISGYSIDVKIIIAIANNENYYRIFTFIILAMGWGVILLYPFYDLLSRYKLTKLYGTIFDRKVSSKKMWGAWQLTHLGTGSRLMNISPNGYNKANADSAIAKCINGFHLAMASAEKTFTNDIENINDWDSKKIDLNNIICDITNKVKDRPYLESEDDINLFVDYVRNEVLYSIMIDVSCSYSYKGIINSPVDKSSPPSWLLDGYYIFMPRKDWVKLLSYVKHGLRSAYASRVSKVSVSANEKKPFIVIDFIINNQSINKENFQRLKNYIDKPYKGDLDDFVKLVSNLGKLLILDKQQGINITDRKIIKKNNVGTLTIRLMMRRINKEEREKIAVGIDKNIDNKLIMGNI